MSNIHIPLEHQSSPKQTEADKAIMLAAQEIADGKFTPEMPENGWFTGTEWLAQHPAVKDALSKLEYEVQKKTAAEYLDKAQELHELNSNAQSEKKWPGQQRWLGKENEEMRLVNPMTLRRFVQTLNTIPGVTAEMEPKVRTELTPDEEGILQPTEAEYSDARLWLGRALVRGYVGLFGQIPQEDGTTAPGLVAKMQVPGAYEWDLLRFNEYGIPVGKRYEGWRTALLQLVRKRVLTEEQVHKAFGEPIVNPASEFYRQQMFELRNGQGG